LIPGFAEAEDFLSHYGDPFSITTVATAVAATKAAVKQGAANIAKGAGVAAEAVGTFAVSLGSVLSSGLFVVPTSILPNSGKVPDA
jgi:hypothetical protein